MPDLGELQSKVFHGSEKVGTDQRRNQGLRAVTEQCLHHAGQIEDRRAAEIIGYHTYHASH